MERQIIPVSLEPVLYETEHFPATVTCQSKYETASKEILSCLNNADMDLFPFKDLVRAAGDFCRSTQLMWFLMLRQVKRKNDEFWMVINERPLRFSLLEFGLLTGLNCRSEREEPATDGTEFCVRHFGEVLPVTRPMILQRLIEMKAENHENRSDRNRVLVAALYFATSALLPHWRDSSPIEVEFLSLAEDLDRFNRFPWGKVSFQKACENLCREFDTKKLGPKSKEEKKENLNINGFVLPLQFLAYENIASIGKKYATRKTEREMPLPLPRMCRWTTKKWTSNGAPRFSQILKTVGDSRFIECMLTPTQAELEADYLPTDGVSLFESDPATANIVQLVGRGAFVYCPWKNRDSHDQAQINKKLARMDKNITYVRKKMDELKSDSKGAGAATSSSNRPSSSKSTKASSIPSRSHWARSNSPRSNSGQPNYGSDNNFQEPEDLPMHSAEKVVDDTPMHSTQKVDDDYSPLPIILARPVREKKKSRYVVSPYTDGTHATNEYELVFDPLMIHPTIGGQKPWENECRGGLKPCDLGDYDEEWFDTLFKSGGWLTDGHICESLHGLHKLQNAYPSIIAQDVAIMDSYFTVYVLNLAKQVKEKNLLPGLVDVLMEYVSGTKSSWKSIPLATCSKICMPFNVDNNHWIALVVDIKHRKITKYDSNPYATRRGLMSNKMSAIKDALAKMLSICGLAKETDKWDLFDGERSDEHEPICGDCGVYTIKYIEIELGNADHKKLTKKVIDSYRSWLSHCIFLGEWNL